MDTVYRFQALEHLPSSSSMCVVIGYGRKSVDSFIKQVGAVQLKKKGLRFTLVYAFDNKT
jgi:hypothetical protein